MKTLRGRRVVVTGAATGIGYETALAFARQGAEVILGDIDEALLGQARDRLVAAGHSCRALRCDVADEESVARFAATVLAEGGPPDILVNNAGIAYLGRFEETPIDAWRRLLDVNVLGVVQSIQAFLPAMRDAGGDRCIVNVASVAGVAPPPNLAAYAATKHAVVGLSESLAMELQDTPIDVVVVCPGIINTQIVSAPSRTGKSITEAQQEGLAKYYREHGVLPSVVGEAIVNAVRNSKDYLFVGPLAGPSALMTHFPTRLRRRLAIRAARQIGYLR